MTLLLGVFPDAGEVAVSALDLGDTVPRLLRHPLGPQGGVHLQLLPPAPGDAPFHSQVTLAAGLRSNWRRGAAPRVWRPFIPARPGAGAP